MIKQLIGLFCQIKVREKRDKRDKSFSCAGVRPGTLLVRNLDGQNVALLTPRAGLIYG